jgi:S-DNA-T family DNA segregation ATPase FtsK/SpoIIIE
LTGALGGTGDETVVLDGTALPSDAPWRALAPVDGTQIGLGTAAPHTHRPRAADSGYEVAVVAGPAAGLRLPLPQGTSTLGRGTAATLRIPDPLLSRQHLRFQVGSGEVIVSDVGSTNRTLLDCALLAGPEVLDETNRVEAGGTSLLVRRTAAALPTGPGVRGGARRAVQRPPRIKPAPLPRAQLVVPSPPTPARRSRSPWLAVVLPLVLGVGIAVFTGRPMFLAFAVLSPVIALATYLSDRSSRRKEDAAALRAYEEATRQHEQELRSVATGCARAAQAQAPDLAQLTAAAARPTALLWYRSSNDPDFLVVRLGTTRAALDVDLIDDRRRTLPPPQTPYLPVCLSLPRHGVVGVSGWAEARDALARALLAQVVVFQSPDEVRVAVLCPPDRAAHWDWVKWLPHCGGTTAAVATDEAGFGDIVDAVLGEAGRLPVVLIDAGLEVGSSPALLRLSRAAEDAKAAVLVLADRFERLSRACRATVELDHRTLRGSVVPEDGTATEDLRWEGIDPAQIGRLARGLAGMAPPEPDPSSTRAASAVPPTIGFLASAGFPDLAPASILKRWRSSDGLVPTALCGVGTDGPVTVDLRSGHDGPNAFVAGMVGSGKSDFLRSFLISLALANPPDALSMVLIDYKEGSGLDALRSLPHVAAVVTNDGDHDLERVLTALNIERTARQQHLKAEGFDNFDAYQPVAVARGERCPPRLLVVVDEFAALKTEVSGALDRLVSVVRRGRSAGMHLLLSTQSVSADVGQAISDNTTLHVCLRVENDSESRHVVGVPDAARLPADLRGRGYVESGRGARLFQCGWLGGRSWQPQVSAGVEVAPFTAVRTRDAAAADGTLETTAAGPAPADLDRVLHAVTDAATLAGVPRAVAPWADPLPAVVSLDQLPDPSGPGPVFSLGLLDATSRRRLEPWSVDLEETGHLLVVGGTRSGRSTVLRTVACAATRSLSADRAALYVVEAASRALSHLAALPTVVAAVANDDQERLARLFRTLSEEVRRRQVLLHERGVSSLGELIRSHYPAPPYLLLVMDDLQALQDDVQDEHAATVTRDLTALLRDGPAVGLHTVLSTDASRLHSRVASAVGARLVLPLPERDQYYEAGVNRESLPRQPRAGRAVWTVTGETVQVAVAGADPDGASQNEAVRRLAAQTQPPQAPDRHAPAGGRPPVPAWPAVLRLSDLVRPGEAFPVEPLIGIGGDRLEPVRLVVTPPGLLVVGPAGSGRSTALVAVATQLAARDREALVVVTPRGGPLQVFAEEHELRVESPEACGALPTALAPGSTVLVDDADGLLDGDAGVAMDALVQNCVPHGHRVIAAGSLSELSAAHRSWCARLKRTRDILMLRAARTDPHAFQLRPPALSTGPIPAPGRGLLYRDGEPLHVQVAMP